jgi:archaetidylinositol phosphate synthase
MTATQAYPRAAPRSAPSTAASTKFRSDRRNTSFVAQPESRLLSALCARLPAWITPDHLTLAGLAGAALAGLGFALMIVNVGFAWLAAFGLTLNWFGDSLDGNLARARGIERPLYGFFVDHIVDALSTFLVMFGLSFSGLVDARVGLIALAAHNLVFNYVFINQAVSNVLVLSFSRFGPTEMRMLLILASAVFAVTAAFAAAALGFVQIVLNVAFVLVACASFVTFVSNALGTAAMLRADEAARQTRT